MVGILSDIHGNLEALQAVLKAGEERGVREWICLGDIVGYGAQPEECVSIIREKCKTVVMGNHDEAASKVAEPEDFNPVARHAVLWTRYVLTDEAREYLSKLPYSIQDGDRLYVHASPHLPEDWNYIFTESEARRQLSKLPQTVRHCFVGHTHEPFHYIGSDGKEIINVGSVGQPRDGDSRASFALLDPTTGKVENVRVEYNITSAREKILAAKLPPFLAERLKHGQ